MSRPLILAALAIIVGADAVVAQSTAVAPSENKPLQVAPPESKPLPIAPVLGPVSDFNAVGDISGNALLGASVRNAAGELVGKIEDVYIARTGEVKSVVLSVGGFLGIGARYVLMSWNDVGVDRRDQTLVLTVDATKDAIRAMPEYSFERRPVRN